MIDELEFTGERFVPTLKNDNAIEHLHRYAFASNLIKDRIVLDVACGEGYGSNLLANFANKVIGIDISKESITHARRKYQRFNLSFICASAIKLPIETNSIEVVVSFETIEHLIEQDEMLKEIKRVLNPDGILIISSPDKKFYSELTGHVNEFHLKELYFSEFKNLLKKYFSYEYFYLQRVAFGSMLCPENFTGNLQILTGDPDKTTDLPTIDQPMYNIGICSDSTIDISRIHSSFFDGTIILKANYNDLYNMLQGVLNSRTYRLGKFLLTPTKIVKRLFKK